MTLRCHRIERCVWIVLAGVAWGLLAASVSAQTPSSSPIIIRPSVAYLLGWSYQMDMQIPMHARVSVLASLNKIRAFRKCAPYCGPSGWSASIGLRRETSLGNGVAFASASLGMHRFDQYPRATSHAPTVLVAAGLGSPSVKRIRFEGGVELRWIGGGRELVEGPAGAQIEEGFEAEWLPSLRCGVSIAVF